MIREIKLPEIADNVHSAIVLEILVSVGDQISGESMVAEMESDKATFELPSDSSGVVKEIKINKGDEVKVGQVMFIIETEAAAAESAATEKEQPAPVPDETGPAKENPEEGKEELPEEEKAGSREPEAAADADEKTHQPERIEREEKSAEIHASPAVRRLARELGADISKIKGTGPHERITDDDVKAFIKQRLANPPAGIPGEEYELPDFSKLGPVRREKMDNIRKITARTMTESWQNIPHVFQFDKADVTELENFRKKYSGQVEKAGGKLTVTAILLKLTAEALKAFPKFNASLDLKNMEIVYKDYINMGVAVDTERGLIVPVIKDADKKSIIQLSVETGVLAEKARNKKIMPDELQGGNFAISNLGGIGGTNFTPIVYRPNVAILGVSRSQMEPVYINGEFKPRMMLPLSLSYDHRIIDGADGARFLRWLCEAIENPLLVMFK